MRKAINLLQIISVALLLGSCGATQLTNLWVDPAYSGQSLKKIMIVAFRKDPVNRRMWEDALVNGMASHGISTSAVPSYRLFPNDIPKPDSMKGFIETQRFDGVLVIARIERDTLTNQMPGYTSNELVTEYSDKWQTYVSHYEDVYHAGPADTSMAVSVQTDLLLPHGNEGQLVWSATSQSINPASRDEFRAEVANTVVKQLIKDRLIR
jgi:hypothetical protein